MLSIFVRLRFLWVAALVGSITACGDGTGSVGDQDLPSTAEIREVPITTNDLVYDPLRNLIYASIPESAGVNGNTVAVINPVTGTVDSYVSVGSEPGKLAISDNAQYLYVALDGAAAVRRVDLTTMTADSFFTLGSDSFFGPRYAEDIEVLPGAPSSIAVSLRYHDVSPKHAGVAIFDDGIIRTTTTSGHTGSNAIEFGGSAARLYGYCNELSEFGFRRMTVTNDGVVTNETTTDLISDFNVDIKYDSGIVFATSGVAIDPETRRILGTFALPWFASSVRPDVARKRVYFLIQTVSVWRVYGFNTRTRAMTSLVTIGSNSVTASSLIRWGADGLALRGDGAVYLFEIQ